MTLPDALAALTLAGWLWLAFELWRGDRHVARLDRMAPAVRDLPGISLVVAARNEAEHLPAALASWLALDYPDLEVIVVDDRSDDATPAILAEWQGHDSRLRNLRIDALPDGWLGKTHALEQGRRAASRPWVLFTDADVEFAPDTLRRAIALCRARGLDHLALAPTVRARTPMLKVMLLHFTLSFSLAVRPHRVQRPGDPAAVGIGAFNLVRTERLAAAGGLKPVRLCPDDDVQLGRRLKQYGAQQGFGLAGSALALDWYPSAPAMLRGLEKGSFAFLDYSLLRVGLASAGILLAELWPLIALPLIPGPARLMNLGIAGLLTGLGIATARQLRIHPAYALSWPLGAALILATLWHSVSRILQHGGLVWRDTFYSLAELRAARRELDD